MLVFLHELLLKVPTPLIWSLKPYGLAVPSCLVQNSSLVLQIEVSRVGFKKKGRVMKPQNKEMEQIDS